MTADTLKSYTLKDLVKIAKQRGVNGWQSMRKEQLVKALVKVSKAATVSRGAKTKAAPVQRSARARSARASSTSSRASVNGRTATTSSARAKAHKVKLASARPAVNGTTASRAKVHKPAAKAAPVAVDRPHHDPAERSWLLLI